MCVITAFFMGLILSAEEIVRDRKILRRESFLNLSWFSYINSKILMMLLFSAIQTVTFVLAGNLILGISGMTFTLPRSCGKTCWSAVHTSTVPGTPALLLRISKGLKNIFISFPGMQTSIPLRGSLSRPSTLRNLALLQLKMPGTILTACQAISRLSGSPI